MTMEKILKTKLLLAFVFGAASACAAITGMNNGTSVNSNARLIQGVPVNSTAPTSGQVILYNSTTAQWEPGVAASVALSDGTLAAPSLYFSVDADTGIYRSAANTMDFAAGAQLGMELKKSTGAFANVAFGGGAASTSDIYAMIVSRDQAQQTAVAVQNVEGSASAGAQIKLIADVGAISSADITLYPTAATLAAYDNRLAVRSADASSGMSFLAAGAANSDIRFYSDGGAAGDEILRLNGDYSIQLMQQIATPATPSSGSLKIYGKSDDKLYWLNDSGAEAEVGAGDITEVSAQYGLSGGGLSGSVSVSKQIDPGDINNCTIATSVASSAMTFTLKTAAGAAPSATDICYLAFREDDSVDSNIVETKEAAAESALVVSNGSSLGCTAGVACTLYVYAMDRADIELGVVMGMPLDEGARHTSTAEGGAGAADSAHVLYSTTARTDTTVRLISRIVITPAASFAWTNAVTEIAAPPFDASISPWYVNAYISGANPSLTGGSITSYTEIVDAGLTLTPIAGSAAVGAVCSTTSAATAVSVAATTCAAGSEGIGFAVYVPARGAYKVCMQFSHAMQGDTAETVEAAFEIVETPTNAQTLTQESGARIASEFYAMNIAGGVDSLVSHPINLCGILVFSSAGTKAIRLMYEQTIGGAVDSNVLFADANANVGQRNIHLYMDRVK